MGSSDVKRVALWFEEGVCRTQFEGDWTGRDIYVAMRQLEKGYRAYQAQRRKAASQSTAVESAKGDTQWSESGSISSGSQTATTARLVSLKVTGSSLKAEPPRK